MPKQELTLKAVKDFNCLAADCPAHCCGEWLVKLDDQVIEKWNQITPSTDKEKFTGRIETLQLDGHPQKVLKKSENGNCSNLTVDGLCELQQKHGHDTLPDTCQNYPRTQIENSWRKLNSVELSCPEVTRLVIESDGGLVLGNKNAKPPHASTPEDRVFRSFDELFMLSLSEKKYPINLRIYYLAWKMRNILEAIEHSGLQSRLLKYKRTLIRSEMNDLMLNYRRGLIKTDSPMAEKFWSLAIDMLGDITNTELHDAYCIDETRSLSSYAEQPDQLYQLITSLRNDVAEQVAIKYRNAMEKYVPLMFINRGLPWNPFAGNIFATYVHATIPIALVSLALWNDYRKKQNIDIKFLQKTIYLIERQLKHTTNIYERLNIDSSLLEMNRFPEFYLEIA